MKTHPSLRAALIITTALLALTILTPYCTADNYNTSYQLLDHVDGSAPYRLNVVVSQSLQDYYAGKSHTMVSKTDFARFVTPYALTPIADCLGEIYADDEDFVNGVLMIVHQIPYEVTTPPKYPVETMVEDKGDCDLFSFIAASTVKAHGIDAVLLYYESESHMNIGVSLPHVPNDAREAAFYVTDNNIRYYVAECTGGNWQTGWRVGECPDTLEHASVQIVTLEGCEPTAPGQVSASYKSLAASTLSFAVSPSHLLQGSTVTFSGQLSPALKDETITIYIKTTSASWTELASVATDSRGQFSYIWTADTAGIAYVRASWSGDSEYAATDSPTQTITILSTFFVVLLGLVVVLVAVGIVVYAVSRKTRQEILAPQPPEIPT